MTTFEFLATLRAQDIELWADDEGYLRYSAPKGAFTPALRAELIERKAEILDILRAAMDTPATSTPILPVPRPTPPELGETDVPLSFGQQRLCLLEELKPGRSAYNLPIAARLTGSLNVAALAQSVSEIVRRHEILRTTFPTVGGQAMQQIAHPARPDVEGSLTIPVIDLQTVPASEWEAESLRRATAEAKQPFDLAQGPLLRLNLLRFAEEEHLFLVTMHHIVSDGWSYDIFFKELATLYDAFCEPSSLRQAQSTAYSSLPELPIQYADFAIWEQATYEELSAQERFWQQQLGGHVPVLQLPTDYPAPASETSNSVCQSVLLPDELTEALNHLSRQEELSLFMTLLAAYNTLLHQYTGQEDLVICSPVIGRNRVETEQLIGYFNNIVVMRTNLAPQAEPLTFRHVLRRVRQVVLDAYDHQEVPFQKVAEFPNLVRTPLARALFVLQDYPGRYLQLSGITVKPLEIDNGMADFDLFLIIEQKAEKLSATLKYKSDLFRATTISQMLTHFVTLLEQICLDPEQSLTSLAHPTAHRRQPSATRSQPKEELEAPRTAVEEQIATLWCEALALPQVGMHQNFFQLGGHSLLATRLMSRLCQAFQIKLPKSSLIEAPTIAKLAALIENHSR